jgi:hypothetical protein
MRIEVELQKILQGQRIAKQNTVTCVDLDLAGRRGRGGLDPVCNQNRARTGSSPDPRESNMALSSRRK